MLSNKNVLITGASSSIGRQISTDCSINNANLILCSRSINSLYEVKQGLKNPESHSIIDVDLTNEQDLKRLVDYLPSLDGVVFNAGKVSYRPINLINSTSIRDVFSVNFDANVLLINHLLKSKKIKLNSSIVFIGSISSQLGNPGTSLYAASKAAISTFSKVLASELVSKGVRSNVISPGLINSQNLNVTAGFKSTENNIANSYPLGLGLPSDISNLAVFLLSSNSRWITGAEFTLDGGYTLTKEK